MPKKRKLESILERTDLSELERSIVERLIEKKKRSIIGRELGILRKKVDNVIVQMRGRGIDIPFSDAERIASKRNALNKMLDIKDVIEHEAKKHEQPQIIFNKIESKNENVYTVIKITTTDRSLIESILRGDV